MSKRYSRNSSQQTHRDLGSDFESLPSIPSLRGPVDQLDGHERVDHLGFVYETREEQFATVVPFVREGLERGERCMYIVAENSRDEVLAALREGGVDVDTALESGQFSLHTVEETYLEGGEFDIDEARALLEAAMEEALAEYEGFRVTAEETWIAGDESAQTEFLACEAHVNDILDGEEAIALCQYNRTELPTAVIEDVLETHPYLVYDDTVAQNFYYTPPEEYFGPDRPGREIDRKLETLVDRTRARATLQADKWAQRQLYTIVADPHRSFEEKLQELLAFGRERFDLEVGGIARVDPATDTYEIEALSGDHDQLEPGTEIALSDTCCQEVIGERPGNTVPNPTEFSAATDSLPDSAPTDEQDVQVYLGTCIPIDGELDRTCFFVSSDPSDGGLSEKDRTFMRLMGQWVQYELERRQRERELRERTEHLNALIETTPECIKTIAPDGTILQINPAGLDMVEADSASDAVGECVYDLIAPEHRDRFREFNERICRDEGGTLEYDIIGLEGTRRHMESHAAPLERPDGTTAHVALTRDVTEQKEREEELRQTKDRFETVFEDSDDGIFILDPDADELVDANPAAAEMTGYTRDELLSQTLSDLHPDELAQFHAFLAEARETGSAWSEDLHCRHRDGHDIPVEITASPITLDGRDLVLALVRHIEERRKHERYQRELVTVTAAPDLSFNEKLEELLELGSDRFGLEMAGLNHLPSWDGEFRLETGVGLGVDSDEELWTDPSSDCFCRQTIESDGPVEMPEMRDTHWTEDEIYQEFGVASYLGTKVSTGTTPYGTLWFGSTEPRDRPFSDAERSFIELMGQWVSYEVERRERKQSQRELYEITADADLDTDAKIERMLELGCDHLVLSVGMLNRDRGDALENRAMHGDHPDVDAEALLPRSSEHYCREVVDTGEPVTVVDADAAGWGDDPLYTDVGIEAYAGVPVPLNDQTYGTLCFADTTGRRTAFTDSERSFLDLMAQCIGYELERAERENRLQALNTLGQEFMDAETATAIGECIADAAEDTLGLPMTAVALYDDETGELRSIAHTDAAAKLVRASTVLDGTDGVAWDAFVANEEKRADDPLAAADVSMQPAVTDLIAHPLGNHGVLLVGSSATDGFGRDDTEFIDTIAANARSAFARTDREQKLQEREDALEEQNQTLSRLNRINDTIRNIDQALVEASTREEIERVVCEELADIGPYEMAWIGDHDTASGEVTPVEWAGAEKGYLDTITVTVDDAPEGCGPVGRAFKTGDPQVVNNVLNDESFGPWRQDALNRGYHAVAAFPLTYKDTQYEMLALYAGQPEVFDNLEREVLTELSNTVAYAINAIESKKALISNEITELEFTVADSNLKIVEMVRELQCEFSLNRLVPQTDGGVRAFFTVSEASAADVLEFESNLAVTDLRVVSNADDDSPCVFEAVLTDESLSTSVLDHGGRLRRIDAKDGTALVTVHLAPDAEIREFVELLQSKCPNSELQAKRTKEVPQQTGLEFTTALTEDLTDRQLEALQTAYFSGYFEEPRKQNASEVADAMGIAQPTFNSHLRAGMRKVYGRLFEDELMAT